jgi:hypothetical protein
MEGNWLPLEIDKAYVISSHGKTFFVGVSSSYRNNPVFVEVTASKQRRIEGTFYRLEKLALPGYLNENVALFPEPGVGYPLPPRILRELGSLCLSEGLWEFVISKDGTIWKHDRNTGEKDSQTIPALSGFVIPPMRITKETRGDWLVCGGGDATSRLWLYYAPCECWLLLSRVLER